MIEYIRTYLTGFIAAGFSVFFAGYMMFNGAAEKKLPDLVVTHVPVKSPVKGKYFTTNIPKRPDGVNHLYIDKQRIITGSIPVIASETEKATGKQDLLVFRKKNGLSARTRYVVRVATSNLALVEGNGRLWSVAPGHLLPGAGRVLKIIKKQKKWVVMTTSMEITE